MIFAQLGSIESKYYDIINSEVFADICDGQILELTLNYRAQNDPEFAEIIQDLRNVKEVGKPYFKMYDNKECRKSLCWTNKTRKLINSKWMVDASKKNKKSTVVNNFKVLLVCLLSQKDNAN